jgi:uncharacterized protein (TIGR03067 family)
MKRRLLAISMIAFAACVAAAEDEATKKDLDGIQGTWRMVSREKDGKADAADAIKDVLMTNEGNKFSFKGSASGAGAMKGTLRLDASKKPKTMDRMPSDGPQKGKTLPGIYSLEGDKLTICVALTGKERPKEFATTAKSGRVLSVFKREK